jgi:hypothetical protein
MNKAFIKEPEATATGHCPHCGSLGIAVGESTLQAQLSSKLQHSLSTSANFCPFPTCDVLYFDTFDRVVLVASVARAVYPKDPAAPICGCFGLTADDIELDLSEGGVARVKELLAKAKSPAARCVVMAASGQCCVAEVQRYYMQRRAALGR